MSPSRILLLLTLMLVGLVTLFQQIGVLFGTSCLFSLVLVVVFGFFVGMLLETPFDPRNFLNEDVIRNIRNVV